MAEDRRFPFSALRAVQAFTDSVFRENAGKVQRKSEYLEGAGIDGGALCGASGSD